MPDVVEILWRELDAFSDYCVYEVYNSATMIAYSLL